jgi:hypothetical protein
MLSPNVRIEGFNSTHWFRLLSLLHGPLGSSDATNTDHGVVIAVQDRSRLVRLFHSDNGEVDLENLQAAWPMSAEALAQRFKARWAFVVEAGSLGAMLERLVARMPPQREASTEVLLVLEELRNSLGTGDISAWPFAAEHIRLGAAPVIAGALDLLCPVGSTLLAVVFHEGEVWSGLSLTRGPSGFERVLGPERFLGDVGMLSGDWRRDHRHILDGFRYTVGDVHLGVFTELSTLRTLLHRREPGAWSRAVAIRDVVLSPTPPSIAIPLGLDAGWAVVNAAKQLADQVDPLGTAKPAALSLARAGFDALMSSSWLAKK